MSDDLYIDPPYIPPTPPNNPPPPETETRNVLDIHSNVIGSLTLLAGLPENIWTQALLTYSTGFAIVDNDSIGTVYLAGTAQVTTSSSTPSVVGNMTSTPPAGRYLAFFSGSINTAGASAQGDFGFYLNGVLIQETRRDISCNLQLLGGLVTISLNSIAVGTYTGSQVNLDGTQTIDIRYRSTNGGTIGFSERTMTLVRVS